MQPKNPYPLDRGVGQELILFYRLKRKPVLGMIRVKRRWLYEGIMLASGVLSEKILYRREK